MKYLYIICLISLSIIQTNQVNGQGKQHIQVLGQITNGSGEPVPYVSVNILNAIDSTLLKNMITGPDGKYAFTGIAPGRYRLAASTLGYSMMFSKPFMIGDARQPGQKINVVLQVNARTLRGVNITAQKPFIEYKPDKTIVNVENSIVSSGSNALEILKRSPGVSVYNNDQISLNGKTGVTIMIDGRLTYLSQQQVVSMLKTMNAASIARIELMTQPSAKYDASGTAGIINIITRKNKMQGFNGNITAGYGQGIYHRENAGASLNYRDGKFNLYGNYDFNEQHWYQDNYITRGFLDGPAGSLSSRFVQNSDNLHPSSNQNIKGGADFYLNDQNTLGLMVSTQISPGNTRVNTRTLIENPDGSIQSSALTSNTYQDRWSNTTFDLNYQGRLDTSGTRLDGDLAYSRFSSLSLQQFLTNTYDSLGNMEKAPGLLNPDIRKGSLPSLISIRTARLNFTRPLGHGARLEAGLKSSLVTSDNNVHYFYLDNGAWMVDSATNHFRYTENINAAYFILSMPLSGGYSIQAGLRGEQTISTGQQFTIDSTVKRNYFQLFPTVFLTRKIDSNNTLSVSYSRRIDRPDYQDLNPFRYYLDPYTYQEGNPFLQPQITGSIELSHTYKGILNTSLNYSRTRDAMTEVLNQIDSEKITYDTRENLASLTHAGLTASLNLGITRWWMTSDFLNVFYNLYRGQYLGATLNFGKLSWMFNSTNTFSLPAGYSIELSGYYQSAQLAGIFTAEPMYQVSGGVQKTILHKQGTIKLNVEDMFNTQHFFGTVKYQNIDVTVNNHWDSRMVNLSFTYDFSRGNARKVQQYRSSIETDQHRIRH